jgi:hypothetical protein
VSFLAATPGAYYATEMERVEREGRIRNVPWTAALPVTTSWDLGVGDATAIVFAQVTSLEVRVIDYYEARGEGSRTTPKVLHEKGYRYHEHVLPHDVEVTELGSGTTRLEILRSLNVRPCRVLAARKLEDGVSAVRQLLPRCYFDRERTRGLLRALEAYHADWKAERQTQSLRPAHDWSSHGADAFRYLAQGLPGTAALRPRPKVTVPLPGYSFTGSAPTPARRVVGPGPGSRWLGKVLRRQPPWRLALPGSALPKRVALFVVRARSCPDCDCPAWLPSRGKFGGSGQGGGEAARPGC